MRLDTLKCRILLPALLKGKSQTSTNLNFYAALPLSARHEKARRRLNSSYSAPVVRERFGERLLRGSGSPCKRQSRWAATERGTFGSVSTGHCSWFTRKASNFRTKQSNAHTVWRDGATPLSFHRMVREPSVRRPQYSVMVKNGPLRWHMWKRAPGVEEFACKGRAADLAFAPSLHSRRLWSALGGFEAIRTMVLDNNVPETKPAITCASMGEALLAGLIRLSPLRNAS